MKVSKSTLKILLIVAVIAVYGSLTLGGSKYRANSSNRVHTGGTDNSAAATQNPPASQTARPLQAAGMFGETPEEAMRRSAGCIDCHKGIEDMHNGVINLGCIDCHGGNADARAQGVQKGSAGYDEAKRAAHVKPRFPDRWKSSANPERPYNLTLAESLEWV